MSGLCPYCGKLFVMNLTTFQAEELGFESLIGSKKKDDYRIRIVFIKCPGCESVIITAEGIGDKLKGQFVKICPRSSARLYPDYVPISIRNDYEEACAIVDLSPKASATLARRCLQGMIHDFWGIVEKNLNAEITALKDKVPASQWGAIDALRKVGNIGAHMEKDIDLIIDVEPGEAKSLIKLIELLIDKWYISRHDEEELLNTICDMGNQKELARKSDSVATTG